MTSIYDVLKASKGIHVDDTFAYLWGRKLSNAYTVATYSGTLPATLQTVEGYLESYKIYGNTVQDGTPTPENPIEPSGCGERTENLINVQPFTIEGDGRSRYVPMWSGTLPVGTYTISLNQYNNLVSALRNTLRITIGGTTSYESLTAGYHLKSGQHRMTFTISDSSQSIEIQYWGNQLGNDCSYTNVMLNTGSTAPTSYIPYGYKLPLTVNGVEYPIYLDDAQLAKDEYVDSTTGKIYRRTKNLSPPEEEWVDEWIWGDGTIHPSTEIKTSPFIDVSTCETCIMEVFSTETEWAAAGYRAMAFYDENKQYLGWIGGGGGQTLTPDSSEMLSEFPAGTVYVRIGCSHGDQPFYPQLVSGYTPTHQFYPYLVPTDPPAPFPQIPTFAGTTVIDYNGTPKPDTVELTYRKLKGQ